MGKWQLYVHQSDKSNIDWIHPKAKYHFFEKVNSGYQRCLCDKYEQDTDYFETGIEESVIAENPDLACKKCFKKWYIEIYRKENTSNEN